MIARPRNRGRLGLFLAALCVCAVPAQALCDELQYLADNPQMILSIDIGKARKTKTFQEVMKAFNQDGNRLDPFTNKIIESDLRLTWSFEQVPVGKHKQFVPAIMVFTAVKPLTIADVVDWFAPIVKEDPAKLKFKETKHGKTTIYRAEGPPFFIDGKYLVVALPNTNDGLQGDGRLIGVLKKIIDRQKKNAELSPVMKAGLKEAALSNTVSLVLDLESFDADTRKDMVHMFQNLPNFGDIKENAGKVEGLALKINETGGKKGKTNLTAALLCADKAGGKRIEEIATKTQETLKGIVADYTKKLKEDKTALPDAVKALDAVSSALNALKISSAGNNVIAKLEFDPAVAGMGAWALVPRAAIKEAKEDVARIQAKVLTNAVETYMIKNGVPPANLDVLKEGTKDNAPILRKDAQLVDPWGNRYQLELLPNGQPNVFSNGPPGGPRIDGAVPAAKKATAPPGK